MTDHDDDESGGEKEGARAKDELFEAIDHFKRAANIFFDRATKDPTMKNAADEAERVIQKVGDAAEPLARQLAGEISKMTKRISESVQEAVERPKKKSAPPPRADDDDDDV
jgi:gas vesicle protein